MNETHFARLLRLWNRHQALRQSGASVADLSASRFELDRARQLLR
jgi:hypothetical protein